MAHRFLARPFSDAQLDGSQYCLTDWLGKLNWGEITCRIQIIISRLINHANLSMPRGVGVRQYLINFSRLQGNLVALVLQAHNKLLGQCPHKNSVDIALDLELSASNAMSFVPVYLRKPSSAIRKSDTGNTLSFPPAAATIELAQSPDFPNGRADKECLDMGDFSNDLEIH